MVTVIIPAWRRADLLRVCLESLAAQTEQRFRVVVISNGGGAAVEAVAREFAARLDCQLIALPDNRGFAAGVNAGLDAALSDPQCQYVAALNDDVRLDAGWLRTMTDWLDAHPATGICSGTILSGDGARLDNLGDAVARSVAAARLGFGTPATAPREQNPRPLLAASWTAIMLRRSVIETVGKLDEQFISYLEDVDYALRCLRAGVRGELLPGALCWHHGGASTSGTSGTSGTGGAMSSHVFRQMTRNQLLLLAKDVPFGVQCANGLKISCALKLWMLMAIRQGRLLDYAVGHFSFLRALPAAWRSRLHWDAAGRARLNQWLRAGEEAIHADQFGGHRPRPDTYWRWYFAWSGAPRGGLKGVSGAQSVSETHIPEKSAPRP